MGTVTVTERNVYYLTRRGYVYNEKGQLTASQTNSSLKAVSSEVNKDDTRRDWRKLIRQCHSATTPLSGTRRGARVGELIQTYQTYPSGGHYSTFIDVGQITFDLINMFSDPSSSIDATADKLARSRFLSHYLEKRNNWRGGNFLAELRETIHAIHHPLDAAFGATVKYLDIRHNLLLKKRRLRPGAGWREVRAIAKALAGEWLAYAFGIRPLIADIQDASKAYNKLQDPDNCDTLPISGKGRNVVASVVVKNDGGGPYTPGITYDYDLHTRSTSSVKYYGRMRARPFGLGSKIEKFGVDIYDVAPAVWEAIPFSWLVDYFVNVSEVLDSQRLWEADLAWLNVGVKNSIARSETSFRSRGNGPTWRNHTISGKGPYAYTYKVSRNGFSIPFPDWQFKMPGFPSLRWLNIAAVIAQRS